MKKLPRHSPGLRMDLVRLGKASVHRNVVTEGYVKQTRLESLQG